MLCTSTPSSQNATAICAVAPVALAELVSTLERENVQLRRQVAWFERQFFGQKTERRVPLQEHEQGVLGEAFMAAPDEAPALPKTRVAAHERDSKPKRGASGADGSTLFFDDKKVPVEVIHVPNSEAAALTPDQYEVIGEKVSHRLAQRPGSYVILKYVRPVIKRRDTQALSCPVAPVGILDNSRADVSFIVGMIIDKLAFHLPLYRQHQRLRDAGI